MMTKPIFVVGSGRNGSYSLYKALQQVPGVEAHHEYHCKTIQKLGCLYYAGVINRGRVIYELRQIHGSAVHYSEADFWVAIGNKESWLIEPLKELFPEAIFIWLTRDGRKTTLSYHYKLYSEMYPPRGVQSLKDYLKGPSRNWPPPVEKPYWWPIPNDHPDFHTWTRWRQVCWHFNEISRQIRQHGVPRFRLEEIVSNRYTYGVLLSAMGLSGNGPGWETIRRPHNVHEPINYQMTDNQEEIYREICGDIHEWLGYDWDKPKDVRYEKELTGWWALL